MISFAGRGRRRIRWLAAFAAAVIALSGTAALSIAADPPHRVGRPNPKGTSI